MPRGIESDHDATFSPLLSSPQSPQIVAGQPEEEEMELMNSNYFLQVSQVQ